MAPINQPKSLQDIFGAGEVNDQPKKTPSKSQRVKKAVNDAVKTAKRSIKSTKSSIDNELIELGLNKEDISTIKSLIGPGRKKIDNETKEKILLFNKEAEEKKDQELRGVFLAYQRGEVKNSNLVPSNLESYFEEASEFILNNRNENINVGKMPSTIESHANLAPFNEYLKTGVIDFYLDNGISIDLGHNRSNKVLKQILNAKDLSYNSEDLLPTITIAGFIKHLNAIYDICYKEHEHDKDALRLLNSKLKVIIPLSVAYLELLEEMSEEPLDSGDNDSNRKKKTGGEEVNAYKKILLDQSYEEEAPVGTPNLSIEEIRKRVSEKCPEVLTTGEAAQFACILAEEAIEHLRNARKRETLFKMRAHLASLFFEETKRRRDPKCNPLDKVIPQKPRYKTPCVFLVRHPINERSEVVTLKPDNEIAYWGNPDTEKEEFALVTVKEKKRDWIENTEAVLETLASQSKAIGLIIAVLLSIAIVAVVLSNRPSNKKDRPSVFAPSQTKQSSNTNNKDITKDTENETGGIVSLPKDTKGSIDTTPTTSTLRDGTGFYPPEETTPVAKIQRPRDEVKPQLIGPMTKPQLISRKEMSPPSATSVVAPSVDPNVVASPILPPPPSDSPSDSTPANIGGTITQDVAPVQKKEGVDDERHSPSPSPSANKPKKPKKTSLEWQN